MARGKMNWTADFKGDWRRQLKTVVAMLDRTVAGDRRASHATREKRERDLFLLFSDLHAARTRFDYIDSFEARHAAQAIEIWEARGVSPTTIVNRMTSVRVFCDTVGKEHVMGQVRPILADKGYYARATAARTDKSYAAAGVDIDAVIAKIERDCPNSAMMVSLGKEFGLRLKEMASFRPNALISEGASSILVSNVINDKKYKSLNTFLTAARTYIAKGTKGGRFRQLPLDTEAKRDVLRRAQAMTHGVNGHLGRRGDSMEQNYEHLRYMCRKHGMTGAGLGITPHSLRHQFANDTYERLLEVASPVRGGDAALTPSMRVARHALVQAMGHSRDSVLSAYCGTKVGLKKVREVSAHHQVDLVRVHLPKIQEILAGNQCEGLFLVGRRACGSNTPVTPWEFVTYPVGEPGRSLRAAEYAIGELLGNTCVLHAMDEMPPGLREAFFKNMWVILEK